MRTRLSAGMEPRLHRVEVEDAVADDHDLAVEARPRRQRLTDLAELREVPEQRPRIPRPEPHLAGRVLEQAAEAVPLRLVLPALTVGQLADELGLHRRERDRRVEVGRTLDGLTAGCGSVAPGNRTVRLFPSAPDGVQSGHTTNGHPDALARPSLPRRPTRCPSVVASDRGGTHGSARPASGRRGRLTDGRSRLATTAMVLCRGGGAR